MWECPALSRVLSCLEWYTSYPFSTITLTSLCKNVIEQKYPSAIFVRGELWIRCSYPTTVCKWGFNFKNGSTKPQRGRENTMVSSHIEVEEAVHLPFFHHTAA